MSQVDILIPTCNRPSALAVTLATLIGQTYGDFSIIVMDQSDGLAGYDDPCAQAVIRVLAARGHCITLGRNLPRRGLAQQRQALLETALAPRVLFLDDDVILEAGTLARMVDALDRSGCGFVGSALIGLSHCRDVRPQQQAVEFWEGDVVAPETVVPDSPAWRRHLLHNAANLWHVQQSMGWDKESDWHLYKLAWAGGCVLFDRAKLVDCGGFSFWDQVPPEHCGEDVQAQLRVMARHGGCGIMPSGAFHQELPTTVPHREVDLAHWVAPAEGEVAEP